jgi:hypothetical protein
MALSIDQEGTNLLTSAYLGERMRYRCLIVQSKDMPTLAKLTEYLIASASQLGASVKVIESSKQFDDVGALSCETFIERLEQLAASPVVIVGPLHFLDYWSDQVKSRFWSYLASFSDGPGILVADTFRTDYVAGPFQVVDGFARGDVRCFKSRLESTQDRLA